ncbi:MAG: hypothetical protein FJ095_12315 [Deltaproteobacteria bacterium]|nr:hypothetical protein [Deltaproteobacteria bacterium]
MNRALGLGIALAVAAVAFDPLVPSALVKAPLLVVVLLAALCFVGRDLVHSSALALALGLLAWLGLGLTWCRTPEPTMLAPWLVLVLALAVGGGLADEERRVASCAFAVSFPLALAALVAIEALRRGPIHGGFGHGNALGLAVLPCAPIAVERLGAALLPGVSRRARAIGPPAAALVSALLVLACSESRTAWVALVFAGVVALAARRPRALWLAVPLILVGGLVLARSGGAHALEGRRWIARASLRALIEVAPFGAGTGGFSRAFLEGQAKELAALAPRDAATAFVNARTPHGDALGLAVVGGVVGVALAAAFVLVAARGRTPGELASLGVVLVAGLGDDVLVTPVVALTIGLTTAARPLPFARRLHTLALVAILLASALLLPTFVRRYGSQRMLHEAERASARLDDPRPLLLRARRIDPTDGEVALGLGLAHLVEREPERALAPLEVARARFADVGASVALGNAEMALDRPRSAVAAYREALRLDPGSFRARANLVEALRSVGALEEARAELAIARTLQPHHSKLEAIAERLRRSAIDDGAR